MTVKETIEMHKGKYDFVEIYVGKSFHTDSCSHYNPVQGMGDCLRGNEESLNSNCMDYEAKSWSMMNCEEYNNSILANTDVTTNDFGWEDEKILCILISRESIAMGEE